jgi:hypothetical protein
MRIWQVRQVERLTNTGVARSRVKTGFLNGEQVAIESSCSRSASHERASKAFFKERRALYPAERHQKPGSASFTNPEFSYSVSETDSMFPEDTVA